MAWCSCWACWRPAWWPSAWRAAAGAAPLLVLGLPVLGVAATTLSTALNFGPANALAWLTPQTLPALLLGTLLAALCALLEPRAAAGLGLAVLAALVVLVARRRSTRTSPHSLQALGAGPLHPLPRRWRSGSAGCGPMRRWSGC